MAVATRRGMLGLLSLGALAITGTAGCSALRTDDTAAQQRQADSAARSRAAAAARTLAALYPSAAAAGFVTTATAAQFQAQHQAHLVRLGAAPGATSSSSATTVAGPADSNRAQGAADTASAAALAMAASTGMSQSGNGPAGSGGMPVPASPLPAAASGTPAPASAALTAAELTATEMTAAHTAVADTTRTSADLAQLLASISACRALHAAVLEPQDPAQGAAPAIAISDSASVGAAQSVLAAENAVIYAFGALGGQLPKGAQNQAHAAYDLHRTQRDLLQAAITEHGAAPVAASAAYRLPFTVDNQASAARLAALVETRLATACANAVRTTAAPDRAYAAWALTGAALRARFWGQPVSAFPGLG